MGGKNGGEMVKLRTVNQQMSEEIKKLRKVDVNRKERDQKMAAIAQSMVEEIEANKELQVQLKLTQKQLDEWTRKGLVATATSNLRKSVPPPANVPWKSSAMKRQNADPAATSFTQSLQARRRATYGVQSGLTRVNMNGYVGLGNESTSEEFTKMIQDKINAVEEVMSTPHSFANPKTKATEEESVDSLRPRPVKGKGPIAKVRVMI